MKKWVKRQKKKLLRIAVIYNAHRIPINNKHYQLETIKMSHKLDKTHQNLHQNNIGKVTQCNCCDKLQILIGTTLMTLNEEDFNSCFDSLNQLADDLAKTKHIETIYLRTPSNHVYITLSQEQFHEAIDLLKGASIIIEINKILELKT